MGLIQRAGGYGTAISSQAISQDATTATSLTVPSGAVSALVTVWGACTYRVDGTAATTATGHYIAAFGSVEIFTDDISAFSVMGVAAGPQVVFVTYFGE